MLDAYGNNNKVTSATLTTRTMMRRRKNARRVLYPAEGKHEDGPRYVAKGARIDPLVPSAPLPPCLSYRSYVPTRTDTQWRCYYRPPTPLLLPSFFLSCLCRSIPVILFLALSVLPCAYICVYVRFLFHSRFRLHSSSFATSRSIFLPCFSFFSSILFYLLSSLFILGFCHFSFRLSLYLSPLIPSLLLSAFILIFCLIT